MFGAAVTEQRISLGRWGEEQARRYLRCRLYRIIATNYRTPGGEIDIIARRGSVVAFVEVKTRRGQRCGYASEAVTVRKQQQIIRAAHWFLARQSATDWQPRFDVIAIQVQGDSHVIEHLIDAFTL